MTFSALIQLLTEALLEEGEPWRKFLLALASYVGAEHATIIFNPPTYPSMGANFTPSVSTQRAQEYLDRYLEIDPFVNLPDGKVVVMREITCPNVEERTAPYFQWLKQVKSAQIMGADIRFPNGFEARLRLTAKADSPTFHSEDVRKVEALLPHIRQIIELHQKLAASRSEHGLLADAVQQLSVGTIFLDHRLDVIRMNNVAASILAEADGIVLRGKKISLTSMEARQQFDLLAQQAVRTSSMPAHGFLPHHRVLALIRPSGKRELAMLVRSVRLPPFLHGSQVPAVALILTDPGSRRFIQADVVRKLFNFTPMEAEVAAAMLSIARNTVRAHLRSIFSKLGLNRQSQLIRLIHATIPEALVFDK